MCRAIKELHRETADALNADHETRAEVERLLGELQQLLAGIAIMQVCSLASLLNVAPGRLGLGAVYFCCILCLRSEL